MRTLIIDNYDSFTYNLVQFMTEINGTDPLVVRNDAPGWQVEDLDEFDNVIISPGPGRPGKVSDFGFSRDVVLGARIPLLGVCLGHQGLCELSGGSVGPAPELFHGRRSEVLHDQTDLFAGLPSPLHAVRYHSLAVTRVPEQLKITAWTADGVIMGVRHRTRPAWGVQFHPESIHTEHGMDLLRNFAQLSREWRRRNPARPTRQSPEPATTRLPDEKPRVMRVLVERHPTQAPAEMVFQSLYGASVNAFWLDSSQADGGLGRFSFLGDSTGPLARVAYADVWQGTVTAHVQGRSEMRHGGFFDWLDADLRSFRVEVPELPFDFAPGWVGYLGYELKAECGGMLAHRSEHPDAVLVFADRTLAVDHATGTTYLLALTDPDHETCAREWLRSTHARLDALTGRGDGVPELCNPTGIGELELRHKRSRYLELIAACQEAIRAGESYEVCLTNMVSGQGSIDPWRAYRFLRRESPAPFGAWLRFADLFVLSTSPERFIRVTRDGVVESKPIKGTRPRGRSAEQDRALLAELANSEKDRAENLMIVDLVRNDLGSCARPGSVRVPKIFDVESYATVHQLVSTVRAWLREEVSAVGCVRAAFPGGSMTGAPKIRTMEIIDSLENGPRGIYSGALGYFSLTGAADLCIVIRTLVITPDKVSFGVGGAIIALSDPHDEFEETAVKAAAMTRLLGTRFPDRHGDSPDDVGSNRSRL
jgi:para-aminobenzoate synthetase